jgi:peptidoglycan/xylan/chitin deacetylase (PgdA/CDA1 family)
VSLQPGRRSPRRRLIAAGIALAVVALAGYAGWRLWLKSTDMLRPVVVLRGMDAAALAEPSIGARVRVLLAGSTGDPAASPAPPRLIALTFDDGPYPVVTPLLLQTLRDLRVPATFFLIGRDADQFPDLARAIAADGHEIADHTLTHPDLDRLGDAAVAGELREGAAALERIVPDPAERSMFRPPHGRYTAATLRAAQSAGYDTILWSDDPGDWRAVPAAALRDHVLARATAPEILLLHSGRQATVAIVPEVVAAFRKAGYRFVTVGTLLRAVPADRLNRPFKTPLSP